MFFKGASTKIEILALIKLKLKYQVYFKTCETSWDKKQQFLPDLADLSSKKARKIPETKYQKGDQNKPFLCEVSLKGD